MIKRTIDVSNGPSYLSLENDQMVITRQKQEVGRAPCEDVGVLLVDHPAVTLTQGLIARLMHYGGAVIVCGPNHVPAGVMVPMTANELTGRRIRLQARAKLPLRKRLWKQVVRRKIALQAQNLPSDDPALRELKELCREVKSGDRTNAEGRAAAAYFPVMFGEAFRRDPEGEPPNGLLNYGYMVMRAAVARAIVAAGLHPAMSLQHYHRNNAFALADDLVEPLRPLVDAAVRRVLERGGGFVDQEAKREILSLLTVEVRVGEQKGPLMVQLQRVVTSLVHCYEGKADRLELPSYPAPP
jgi:CRISPR-associated protein Cas1